MPIKALMMGKNGDDAVTFVAATDVSYFNSTTSASGTSPSGIQNGDGLFAILYGRSTVTAPAGWSLVASKAKTNPENGNVQTVYIYRKDAVTSSDSSVLFTWTQASLGRMGIAFVVVRSSSGSIVVAQTGTADNEYSTSTAYPHDVTVATLTATTGGELFLIAATVIAASSGAGTNVWQAGSGATLRTSASVPENRLAVATQSRNAGEANATPMSFNAGSPTTNYYAAITVRLNP